MLFFRALLTLFAYDVLSTFCRFETIYSMVKRWTVASAAFWSRHHQPCLHGGQLRLHLVPETGSLPAALLRHYVFAQEARRRRTHGPGRTETSVQGPCVGRSRRAGNQRAIECPGDLRRLGSLLTKEIGMSVQAGIWNFDGRPVDRKLLENLSDSLRQQGPDGESRYVDGSVALLYRPFHTTAESRREKQPYISRRGFILTWDGRLDNREVLIAELAQRS